ncbi:MAG: quinoprotein relay system zinc metallohydrolase 2, partial [Burkholderiaceae bacterium]
GVRRSITTLLHGAVLSGLLAWAGLGAAQSAVSVPPLTLTQVQPGVYVHFGALKDWGPENGGDVANLGFIVGSRCVAVVDTGGTPRVGQALRAAIEHTTALPVCYVINTHAHPDHVLGSTAFASATPRPRFVASAGFARTLSAREPYYLNALQRDFGIELTHASIVYPDLTVEQSLDLDLGDRVLTLQAWPTAHTDNDLTVYDRRSRTLFASDLLFVQHVPVVDGSLRGWIEVLAQLARLDVATVVPGHGPSSTDWPAALRPETEYLNGLLRDTRTAIRKLQTIRQAIDAIGVPAGSHWLLTDRFQRRNVTAAYAELEWEDEPPAAPASPSSAGRAVRSIGPTGR